MFRVVSLLLFSSPILITPAKHCVLQPRLSGAVMDRPVWIIPHFCELILVHTPHHLHIGPTGPLTSKKVNVPNVIFLMFCSLSVPILLKFVYIVDFFHFRARPKKPEEILSMDNCFTFFLLVIIMASPSSKVTCIYVVPFPSLQLYVRRCFRPLVPLPGFYRHTHLCDPFCMSVSCVKAQ